MTADHISDELSKRTQVVYERNAQAFDEQRSRKFHEQKWIDKFIDNVPHPRTILDVGCGAGEPFIPYFLEKGLVVEGCDFSEGMLAIAEPRFPQCTFHKSDMRYFDLNKSYDGLLAWNSFFHLTRDDQYFALSRFAAHLVVGGILMVTVGPEAGTAVGHVNGEEIYHASLSNDEYIRALRDLALDVIEFVNEDKECDFQTIILARKV